MTEKKARGFASMDEAKQRAIASKGGRAAHQKGTAHEFTPEEARAAGRKGGQAAHRKGTAHQFTSEEARAAGRKGGQAVRERRHGNSLSPQREQTMPSDMNVSFPAGTATISEGSGSSHPDRALS